VNPEWKNKVRKGLSGKPPELQIKLLKAAKRLFLMRAVESEVASWTGEGEIPLSDGLMVWMDTLAPESKQAIIRIATRTAWMRSKGKHLLPISH
jgi:hypothetical protein